MRKLVTMCLCIVLAVTQIAAQSRTVKGKITDDKNNPVANASVLVKGTTTGTTSGADGSFSLNVPATAKVLVISSLNFTTQEVAIGTKTNITVSLQSSSQNLQEVVVVGYGTQRKQDVTASIAKVGGEKVANVPLTSLDQILQGKVAGLQSATFSGQPGANQQVRIRGIGSISASSQPLYVVDGIQINAGDLSSYISSSVANATNVLASINPDDIESISVLKDAAAVAVYGARGGNGVIVITTNKGKAGKTQFNFSAENGNTSVLNLPNSAKPINSSQWLNILQQSYLNAGGTAAQAAAAAAAYGDGTVNSNWLDLVTRQGVQSQYNLSVSGGDEKTTFFASAGYFKQESSTIGSDFKRITSNIRIDHKVNQKLSFGIKLAPTYTNQNTPLSEGGYFGSPVLAIWFLRPTQNPYNADGTLNTVTSNLSGFPNVYNPLYIAAHDIRTLNGLNILSDIHATYEVVRNLKFSSKVGIQYDNLEENGYNNPVMGDGKSLGGRGVANYSRYVLYNITNQLDYHTAFLKDKSLTVDAKIAYEYISSKQYNIYSSATGYATPVLPLTVNAANITNGVANGADYAFNSAFSTASIGYKGRYILAGSFRRDGSSRFGLNNQFGTFPAASFAWNLSQEKFMSDIRFISDVKLRASYGTAGNAEIGNYTSKQLFGFGYNYNSTAGGTFNTPGNVNLTWEKNTQTDLGIEFSMFRKRVNVIVDYYKKKVDGLLFNTPISQTTGFSTLLKNVGAMENKGVELTINATPVTVKDFTWDISFNLTHNTNKITKLPDGQNQIISGNFIWKPGYDFQTFFMRQWAGVDPANGNPLWYVDSSKGTTTSNYNAAARVPTGRSASPTYYGGLSNTFTYRNFSIGADLYYNYGNYIQDTWAFYLTDMAYPTAGKYGQILSAWQKPGDVTNVPKVVYGSSNFSSNGSTRFSYKGDYIRLRNVTVSYSASASLVKKLHLNSLRFYVRGTNLWTKTYDTNLTVDPEQSVNGLSNLNILYSKSITGGINIGF